jgi:hypothetical protein
VTDLEYRRLLRWIFAGLIVAVAVNMMAIALQITYGMPYLAPASVSGIALASGALWLVCGRLKGRR